MKVLCPKADTCPLVLIKSIEPCAHAKIHERTAACNPSESKLSACTGCRCQPDPGPAEDAYIERRRDRGERIIEGNLDDDAYDHNPDDGPEDDLGSLNDFGG
jgi:hypothetical protein